MLNTIISESNKKFYPTQLPISYESNTSPNKSQIAIVSQREQTAFLNKMAREENSFASLNDPSRQD